MNKIEELQPRSKGISAKPIAAAFGNIKNVLADLNKLFKFEPALCPAGKSARRELREMFASGGIVLAHRPPEQTLHKPRDASFAIPNREAFSN